jgi:hypothetical protein
MELELRAIPRREPELVQIEADRVYRSDASAGPRRRVSPSGWTLRSPRSVAAIMGSMGDIGPPRGCASRSILIGMSRFECLSGKSLDALGGPG